MQEELKREFDGDNFDQENVNERGEELTPERAEALGAKISEFTMKVMAGLAQVDPGTGRKIIKLGESDFELKL